jgi:hypothetical protein
MARLIEEHGGTLPETLPGLAAVGPRMLEIADTDWLTFLVGFQVTMDGIYGYPWSRAVMTAKIRDERYFRFYDAVLFPQEIGHYNFAQKSLHALINDQPELVYDIVAIARETYPGLLYQRIRLQVEAPERQRWLLNKVPFLSTLGPVGQLVVLECKLMLRNRRPKHYLLVSLLFSTVYLVFLLSNPSTFGGMVLGAVVGLFASGGFVLNYGQLMFSWESSYFNGLLARNIDLRQYVQAKLLLLQGSCVALFLISLPLFLWLKPEMLPLHIAFLFYNAGVTSLLILILALNNRERIDLSRSGGFFNYEGFSVVHWLWFFPTMIPPVLILFFLRDQPDLGLLVLSTMGAVGLLLSRFGNYYFARMLIRNRYKMAEGFNHDR